MKKKIFFMFIYSAAQCRKVQCNAVRLISVQSVQCSAVQCSAVQCSAVQCSAVQCSALKCNAVHCSTPLQQRAAPMTDAIFTDLSPNIIITAMHCTAWQAVSTALIYSYLNEGLAAKKY